MKPQKKTVSRRRQLIILAASLVVAIAVIAVVKIATAQLPTWKYTHSFRDGKIVCSVDKASKQYKSSKDDFFLVHCYDFTEKKFLQQIRVDIADGQDYRAEYLGCSKRYVWLKTPELTAVDMASETFEVLDFAALTGKICQANSTIFKSVLEAGISENRLTVTNQDGDSYYLNLSTFKVTQDRGDDFYAYNPDFTILQDLPKTLQENDEGLGRQGWYVFENAYTKRVRKSFVLCPVSEQNTAKSSLFCTDHSTPGNATRAMLRITDLSFLNAKGIGISDQSFLLICQKKIAADAPWYFVRYNLESGAVQWTDLAAEGLKFGDKLETFTHGVSTDSKWLFLFIEKQAPVRIRL